MGYSLFSWFRRWNRALWTYNTTSPDTRKEATTGLAQCSPSTGASTLLCGCRSIQQPHTLDIHLSLLLFSLLSLSLWRRFMIRVTTALANIFASYVLEGQHIYIRSLSPRAKRKLHTPSHCVAFRVQQRQYFIYFWGDADKNCDVKWQIILYIHSLYECVHNYNAWQVLEISFCWQPLRCTAY